MDSKGRFSWNDDDVVLKDEDGNVITPREALEQQLDRLRAEADAESTDSE